MRGAFYSFKKAYKIFQNSKILQIFPWILLEMRRILVKGLQDLLGVKCPQEQIPIVPLRNQVSKIFTTWICFLHHELPTLFPFPSQDLVRKNMPPKFKPYPNTRVIIDCTEIRPVHRRSNNCYSVI